VFDSDWFLVIYLDPAGIAATFEHPAYDADDDSYDARVNLTLPMGLHRP